MIEDKRFPQIVHPEICGHRRGGQQDGRGACQEQ